MSGRLDASALIQTRTRSRNFWENIRHHINWQCSESQEWQVDTKVGNSGHYKIRNFVIGTNCNRFKKGHTRICSGGNTRNVYTVLVRDSPRKVSHLEKSEENQTLILTCSHGNGLWENKANQTNSGTCLLTRALKLHHIVFDQLKISHSIKVNVKANFDYPQLS